ncbi:ACT domain-containing protein ACR8 [Canna indica]|uniref:ACT domain-containing protein ACR n=1 Tax=Canna indica TaxID=4628 RepID=A0AAQ3Q3L7_9LILI|nr:ACT domain-containing protein ACR8 [Canna indica]
MEWPTNLDEYEKLVIRMNNPRVVIDNAVCPTATLVKVDSASKKHGVLLEAIQVLTDLNLSVKKAYISSDGRWFMDVFHVTDQFGHKLTDDSVISCLEQSLDTGIPEMKKTQGCEGLTTLELTGTDRPGLLSEVFAVLADLHCGVAEATVWTHNGRIACLLFVKDELSGSPIEDAQRIHRVESRLRHVLKGDHDVRGAKTAVTSMAVTNVDRRLHQLMLADRDYERSSSPPVPSSSVSVQNWLERGYSVVNVQCQDRPKLLFDIVCTLTDMEYVVFHGTIDTDGDLAQQELYIRHKDGSPISSEAERQRVIQCLQAAIERRASESTRLELCMPDRPGLLSDVTRTFRENGLLVTRAEVSTKGDMASDVFCVTDATGQPADPQAIEAVREIIGLECLKVKEEQRPRFCRKDSIGREESQSQGGVGIGLLYLGSLVRRNLYNLGLIKSCS